MRKFLITLFLILSAIVLIGCGTQKQIAVVDRIQRDTIYINKVQYDSIYHNDSFLMDYRRDRRWDQVMVADGEVHKPYTINYKPFVDTMYIRDKNVEYKYKYLHDTTYVHRVDTIPVIKTVEVVKQERYTPWYAKTFAWLGVILLIGLIIRIVLKIYLK